MKKQHVEKNEDEVNVVRFSKINYVRPLCNLSLYKFTRIKKNFFHKENSSFFNKISEEIIVFDVGVPHTKKWCKL